MATGYEVKVSRPGARRGEEIEVPGLGLLKNGSTRLVTPDEANAYRAFHRRSVVSEEYEGPHGEPIYETVEGPTLLEAFRDSEWVEVIAVSLVQDGDGEWQKQAETPATNDNKGGDK